MSAKGAVLTHEEFELELLILVDEVEEIGVKASDRLRAHDAALRAKLAERDRLLARCAETMRHNLVDPPTINPLDFAYARVHDENRCVLCAVKAALEKP